MSLHKMLRARAGYQAPAPANTDPQFNYVSMLLHGDGTNGSQNNTFIDSSTNNFTITRNGNTTQGSLSPYGDLWSNYFDGNDLSVANNTALDLTSGNWTVEGWFYATSFPNSNSHMIVCKDGQSGVTYAQYSVYVGDSTNRKLTASIGSGASGTGEQVITGATSVSANTWNHFAFTFDGTTLRLFLNGSLDASAAKSFTMTNGTYPLSIARQNNNTTNRFFGYISNLRIVKGTALYTSAFTPSTTPLTAVSGTSLLTCQSNRFIDNSANNFTITRNGDVRVTKESPFLPTAAYSTSTIGGSGYFDGNGDWLSLTLSAATGSTFTVEAWVYLNAYPAVDAAGFVSTTNSANSPEGWFLRVLTDGRVSFGETWGQNQFFSTDTVPLNTWTHVAGVRNGSGSGNAKIYVNGVLQTNTGTFNKTYTSTSLVIGRSYISNTIEYVNGYISNVRVTSTAVYTATFTPPTAPVTAISGTSLLLNFTNAGIFDNAAENDLETVGNAKISTSVKKYGTGSLAFDGNGDYLYKPADLNFDLGNTYTIELWVYPTIVSGFYSLFDIEDNDTPNFAALILAINSSAAYFEVRPTTGAAVTSISGGSVATNTWSHLAISVSNGSGKLFLNGTQVGSTTTIPQLLTRVHVGIGANGNGNGPSSHTLNGYIDDLRITKGYARYTANFTPPTAAFPDQ